MAVRWMTRAPDTEPLQEKRAVVTVQVQKATRVTVADTRAVSGTVQARDRLQISSEVNGLKIDQVMVSRLVPVATTQTADPG